MKRHSIIVAVFILIALSLSAQTINNYKVYDNKTDNLQIEYLLNRLKDQFDDRRDEFEISLESKEALKERQQILKNWYNNLIPQFKKDAPLNIVTTKKVELNDYSIEWVAYESQPNHHVTGLLYVPTKREAPFPAVYIPCGHSLTGKGSEAYQKAARLFALNGFVVLQADPICQGERMQYLDDEGKQITEERMLMHEILGQKLLLTGSNTVIHELLDNVRGLDFLEQHPEVDKSKIAIAGNSGGGTQVTYLIAFDDRVKVATPSCYISTTENKFNTIGSQDGCQQLWGEGKIGVEEQDFLLMAAPKPIRILSATEDFFNIVGARKAYGELKRAYTVLGSPEKIDQIVAEGKHGWQKALREASVQWCKMWLVGDDSPVVEPEGIGFYINDDLNVTSSGQVLTFFENEKSVSDLTRARLEVCKNNRTEYLSFTNKCDLIKKVKSLIGFEDVISEPNIKHVGGLSEKEFTVEKYLISRDAKFDFNLPVLYMEPKEISENVSLTIIVSEFGKLNDFKNDGIIRNEIKKGNCVLALDVTNTGELKNNKEPKYDNKEFWVGKLAIYEGKTLLAYRTEDVLIAKNIIPKITDLDFDGINIISVGYTGPAVLHAAFFDDGFSNVDLINSIESWEDIAESEYSANQLGNIVPNVLNYYELSDIIKNMKKTKVEFK